MEIYIVGQITTWPAWKIVGIYDDIKKAEAECKNDADFIGPATMNEKFADFSKEWPGAYRPKVNVKATPGKDTAVNQN